jgi:hypothetical protein
VREAIINNPGAFRAGAVGPDFYPDMLLGQAAIHADRSGWWVDLMFKRLLLSVPSEREKNLAFTLGYMVHYAGDMFGHAYVNSYANGWFPPFENLLKSTENAKIVMRHMLVEMYMDKRVKNTPLGLTPPINFIYDVFTCNDALSRMADLKINDSFTNPLGKFIGLRKSVHNDLLGTAVGLVPGVTKYVQNWEEDVETGIRSWLEAWSSTSNIFAGSADKKAARALDLFEKWFYTKFLSMIGFPDFVGKVISFISDINLLKPLKDLIKGLIKDLLIALAKAALGKIYTDLEEVIKHIEEVFKNLETWLDNKMIFNRGGVSAELKKDFGNYGNEKDTTKQEFHAFLQCLNMCKLCLVGTDNLNSIVKKASGNVSYKSANFATSARMGYITVKTKDKLWAGTDNNVYIGIKYGKRSYEVLCDKPFYNDFERGDRDTYPFFLPENIDLSTVTAITARMSGHTPGGDWDCDWIEIKDCNGRILFRADDDFCLSTGKTKEITKFNKYYPSSAKALRIDPKIMSFLWSLDGKGHNSSNPAVKKQWELGTIMNENWSFPFRAETNLYKNVFRPLFETPYVPPTPQTGGTSTTPQTGGTSTTPQTGGSGNTVIVTPGNETVPVNYWSGDEHGYCVNKNYQGTVRGGNAHYEMHRYSCSFLPKRYNRIPLGVHETIDDAQEAAREAVGGEVDGCYWCCRELHTQ